MKNNTFTRQGSIGRSGLSNLGDIVKRGSGGPAFRETFATARLGSVSRTDAGRSIALADVLKAMLRSSGAVGFELNIALHVCL